MSGPNAPYTQLDANQVLQQAFDESTDRLRVDASITLDAANIEVELNASDDSIQIKDPSTNTGLKVNTDGSTNSRLHDASGNPVTLGQKGPTQSIPVVLATGQSSASIGTVESGTVETSFNEILSVASGAETQVVFYTAVTSTRLKTAEVTGTNIATYTVYVNGSPIHKKRTYFGNLDNNFQFSKGYQLEDGDVVTITTLHNQSSPGDFSGFILVLKDE